jgi:hypothetical protein
VKKTARKEYRVSFRINLITSTTIPAASLEDALTAARALHVTDLIDIGGEHDDSAIAVEGVSDTGLWDTKLS